MHKAETSTAGTVIPPAGTKYNFFVVAGGTIPIPAGTKLFLEILPWLRPEGRAFRPERTVLYFAAST